MEVYFDDIIIHAKTIEEHNDVLNKTLKLLDENNFKINEIKVQYLQNKVTLLGV